MNIVLLTSVDGNGGSPSTAYHTARLLARAGHQATLFAPGNYWKERGAREGVAVDASLELKRGFHPLSFWRDWRRFRKFMRAQKIDAVLVQKSPEQWLARFALAGFAKKVGFVRLRGVVFAIKPSSFNRWLHHSQQRVACSASVIAEQYAKLPGFDRARVRVLLEGVDIERYTPATLQERAEARKTLGLDPEALVLGTAGRPSSVKGHDLLLRAFAKAGPFADRPPVKLAIFWDESRRGPGAFTKEQFDASARELGVAERVLVRPGKLDDMRTVYRALDAYILPSRGSEGSSRAGLEASASGLPLIASHVGVLPDLIEDGQTGRLVPPNDEAALAAALKELIAHWPAAQSLGAAARTRMEAKFRDTQYADALARLIEEAVAEARAK